MRRVEAREFVLSALYQREFLPTPLDEILSEVDPAEQRAYIERVFTGIIDHREEIDALIGGHTIGWRFERLGLIDRNILRIGVFELLYDEEIPPEVAIDQAGSGSVRSPSGWRSSVRVGLPPALSSC